MMTEPLDMYAYRSVYCPPSVRHFTHTRAGLARRLLKTTPFSAGKWQTLDVSASRAHDTYELLNVTIQMPIPASMTEAQLYLLPDLPWAEDHFQERVGGAPINPGNAEAYWPYHAGQGSLHKRGDKIYDHNYMERMWAGKIEVQDSWGWDVPWTGYRFPVGDLGDVVEQLKRDPGTRQAYLPIWFPEDTGATKGQRVPCSLGYHFIIRGGRLHVQYNLRSCEIYRHFTNDVYLAVRLGQWMADKVGGDTGMLTMHMISFHGFVGDTEKIQALADEGQFFWSNELRATLGGESQT